MVVDLNKKYGNSLIIKTSKKMNEILTSTSHSKAMPESLVSTLAGIA